MKDIFMLIRRFIAPYYKGYLSLAVTFNILSALLNLVAFALVMPILNILFQIEERVTTYIPFSSLDLTTQAGWSQMKEVVTNNFGYFVSQLIETEGASYTLIILGVYLVLMTLLKVGATYLGGFFLVPIRTGVVRDLRNQLNAKILALPLGFFSEERKGDVLARITGDVGEVENSVMSSLDLLLKNPILIFVYLGSMLLISWQLTLFVFLVLPIAGFVMGRVGKSLKRTSLEAQNQWGQLISQVEETLGGLRIVKAFTAEEFVDKRFRDSNEEYRQTVIGVNRRQLLAHGRVAQAGEQAHHRAHVGGDAALRVPFGRGARTIVRGGSVPAGAAPEAQPGHVHRPVPAVKAAHDLLGGLLTDPLARGIDRPGQGLLPRDHRLSVGRRRLVGPVVDGAPVAAQLIVQPRQGDDVPAAPADARLVLTAAQLLRRHHLVAESLRTAHARLLRCLVRVPIRVRRLPL